MSKGLNGLNPRNQAFKHFKCPILNALTYILTILHKVSRTQYTKMTGSIQQKALILTDTELPGHVSL